MVVSTYWLYYSEMECKENYRRATCGRKVYDNDKNIIHLDQRPPGCWGPSFQPTKPIGKSGTDWYKHLPAWYKIYLPGIWITCLVWDLPAWYKIYPPGINIYLPVIFLWFIMICLWYTAHNLLILYPDHHQIYTIKTKHQKWKENIHWISASL